MGQSEVSLVSVPLRPDQAHLRLTVQTDKLLTNPTYLFVMSEAQPSNVPNAPSYCNVYR